MVQFSQNDLKVYDAGTTTAGYIARRWCLTALTFSDFRESHEFVRE
jgi:hypothetical protein